MGACAETEEEDMLDQNEKVSLKELKRICCERPQGANPTKEKEEAKGDSGSGKLVGMTAVAIAGMLLLLSCVCCLCCGKGEEASKEKEEGKKEKKSKQQTT